jgi:hypothetical protein
LIWRYSDNAPRAEFCGTRKLPPVGQVDAHRIRSASSQNACKFCADAREFCVKTPV